MQQLIAVNNASALQAVFQVKGLSHGSHAAGSSRTGFMQRYQGGPLYASASSGRGAEIHVSVSSLALAPGRQQELVGRPGPDSASGNPPGPHVAAAAKPLH
jgi:hypothetical protein